MVRWPFSQYCMISTIHKLKNNSLQMKVHIVSGDWRVLLCYISLQILMTMVHSKSHPLMKTTKGMVLL